MTNFYSSPAFSNSSSYSNTWPSKDGPADDGSCGTNVAVAVLQQYDIPIKGGHPTRGRLCGLDINNMAASDAINLSLAENMKDGKFIECYMDADGFAYFQEVYPNAETAQLEIRTCIPTSTIDSKTDLVIVRGYDTPPVRSFKDFEGLEWDPVDSLANHIDKVYCQGHHFATEAWKSYKDPVLETAYKDGVENLYELEAFESLIGYVIEYDGPTDPNIKCSQSASSTKLVEIPFAGLACCDATLVCGETGSSRVMYAKASYPLGNFKGTDKFGDDWPLLLSVQGVYLWGSRVLSVVDTTAALGGFITIYVQDKKKLINLPGNNWNWELDSNSAAMLHLYASTYEGDAFMETISATGAKRVVPMSESGQTSPAIIGGVAIFPDVNGALGMAVEKCIVAVEIDRPSFIVHDPNGDAISYTRNLDVHYQPIIVTDRPAPIAYTFGGTAKLVDHTKDLYDADPSTQQTPPSLIEGSQAWLQTQTSGRTVDISLPFCGESDCLELANTIYNMQDENISTYQMVCGPNSEPKLGQRVDGFEGRINRISHSYTDSSSYTINVTVGSTFTGAKGWSTSIWQRKTEDVSREGIVVWSAGDGVNYRVRVQGLGVYPAVNKTLSAYSPGEKVKVTVYNNPVET